MSGDQANTQLAVGVIAQTAEQLGQLTRLLKGAGYQAAATHALDDGVEPHLTPVDAWVAQLDSHDPDGHKQMEILDASGLPVIYTDDSAASSEDSATPAEERQQKEKRLALKLRQLVRQPSGQTAKRAQKLWVLAASTGGPDAVAEFLAALPNSLPGVALLYVQHTDVQAIGNLAKVVKRHCKWAVEIIETATVIRENTLYLVSPQHQIELSDAGVVSPLREPWSGHYKPSIDLVIARVARIYPKKCGVIIFTGMGDDGAASCNLLHHRGGQVWVQDPASCTIDSMPLSATKKGCVQYSATPAELARQFVKFHKYGSRPPKN